LFCEGRGDGVVWGDVFYFFVGDGNVGHLLEYLSKLATGLFIEQRKYFECIASNATYAVK
jgi:hypothetical protein